MEHAYFHATFSIAVCSLANKLAEATVAHVLAGDVLARLFELTASDFQVAGLNRTPEQTLNCPVALSQPFSNVSEGCL